jgi:hypothetical protein
MAQRQPADVAAEPVGARQPFDATLAEKRPGALAEDAARRIQQVERGAADVLQMLRDDSANL